MKSNINDLELSSVEDTQKAIQLVKKRIKLKEQLLEQRIQQLPQETLKAGIGMIIPAFINSKISGRTWNIIIDAIRLLSPFSTDKISVFKDVIKQVGVIGLFKTIINFLTKKQTINP